MKEILNLASKKTIVCYHGNFALQCDELVELGLLSKFTDIQSNRYDITHSGLAKLAELKRG